MSVLQNSKRVQRKQRQISNPAQPLNLLSATNPRNPQKSPKNPQHKITFHPDPKQLVPKRLLQCALDGGQLVHLAAPATLRFQYLQQLDLRAAHGGRGYVRLRLEHR
jgi:hypothetical protein